MQKSLLSEMHSYYASLRNDLEQIRRRGEGCDEIMQFLIDMLDAGELELCEERSHGEIRAWKAAENTQFVDRYLILENEVWGAVAELFMKRFTVFVVNHDTPPQIEWSLREPSIN